MPESTWQWFLSGGSQQLLLTAIVFLLVGLFLGKRMRSSGKINLGRESRG
jgi:hypothetical protein